MLPEFKDDFYAVFGAKPMKTKRDDYEQRNRPRAAEAPRNDEERAERERFYQECAEYLQERPSRQHQQPAKPKLSDEQEALVARALEVASWSDFVRDVAERARTFGKLSPRQEEALRSTIERAEQKAAAQPSAPARVDNVMPAPKLQEIMERLAKLRATGITLSRKNGTSLVWILGGESSALVGRIENGEAVIFPRKARDAMGEDGVARAMGELSKFEADPLKAAQEYGHASGRCCVCGRDLTDPESIEAGIGPICAGRLGG